MVWTINSANAFETFCALLSALEQQHHLGPNSLWCAEPFNWAIALRHGSQTSRPALSHILNISRWFMSQGWLSGVPTEPPSFPAGCRQRVAGCYLAAHRASSFDILKKTASPSSRRAVRSFQRALFRWQGVPWGPQVGAAVASRSAVLLQRWPRGRVVLNEAAVLEQLKLLGYEAHAVVPERVALATLLKGLHGASLCVTIHGAGLINQLWMQSYPEGAATPARGAVIEAFPPGFIYSTGFALSSLLGLFHQPLFLTWTDADLSAGMSEAAFNRSTFVRWGWSYVEAVKWFSACTRQRPRQLFQAAKHMCSGIRKALDYSLPLRRLALLVDVATRSTTVGSDATREQSLSDVPGTAPPHAVAAPPTSPRPRAVASSPAGALPASPPLGEETCAALRAAVVGLDELRVWRMAYGSRGRGAPEMLSTGADVLLPALRVLGFRTVVVALERDLPPRTAFVLRVRQPGVVHETDARTPAAVQLSFVHESTSSDAAPAPTRDVAEARSSHMPLRLHYFCMQNRSEALTERGMALYATQNFSVPPSSCVAAEEYVMALLRVAKAALMPDSDREAVLMSPSQCAPPGTKGCCQQQG